VWNKNAGKKEGNEREYKKKVLLRCLSEGKKRGGEE